MSGPTDYTLFKDFIAHYLPQGFLNINRHDPFVIALEEKLKINKQFFYVADLLKLKILFVSSGSCDIIGVEPDALDLSTFYSRTHPDDQIRYGLARTKYIKTGPEILVGNKKNSILSTHFRQLGPSGDYFNLLFQGYMFYSEIPSKTVYTILVLTNLSKFEIDKHGYHFYFGDDLKLFRYPDAELLKIAYHFSSREFEILQLIADGLDSDHIARKLYLSPHTINTHRRNILKKTKKLTTHDLVIELQEKGIL